MSKTIHEYRQLKSARGNGLAIGVLIFSLLTLALPSILITQFVSAQNFVPSASYIGSLATSRDPIMVNLPADLPIAEVLVARGQDIRQGETVATFDTAALTGERNRIENATAALVLERRCLLDSSLSDDLELTIASAETALEQRLFIALESCRSFLEEENSIQKHLQESTSLAAERHLLLLEQRARLGRFALDAAPSERHEILLAALKVDLQILGIREQRHTVENRHQMHAREGHMEKISRLRTLTDQIDKNVEFLDRVDAALEFPRVVSPVAGRVQRVRAIQRGAVLPKSTELLQVAPNDTRTYNVSFSVSFDTLGRIRVGQALDIRALGDTHAIHLPLSGQVAALTRNENDSNSQMVMVSVKLDAESVARLSRPDVRLALHGTETASIVTLKLQTTSVWQALARILERNCLNSILFFCSQKVTT